MFGDESLDLGQAIGVVRDDLVEPAGQIREPVLVGGEHLVDGQVLALEQRLQVLTERVGELLGVDTDVGRDAGEHVVAPRGTRRSLEKRSPAREGPPEHRRPVEA